MHVQDYDHELVCITEREKFLVSVKAIGTRALLDFPDEITFSSAPVKVTQSNMINSVHYLSVYSESFYQDGLDEECRQC